MTNILIIGDPHAHPDYDNTRFDLLGKYIVDTRPDVIVCMGDLADMPSLSSYDRGTTGFEGRRYTLDIAAAVDAQERLWAPLHDAYWTAKANHKARYSPRRIFCVGNHEDRIARAANSNPHLSDSLSLVGDLQLEKHWTDVIPFKVPVTVAGVVFRHFHPNRGTGRAVSGVNLARSVLNASKCSSVVGHSHVLDYAECATSEGKRMFAMSAGCFGHPDHSEGWSTGTDGDWWRGVIELDSVKDGYYGRISKTTLEHMEKM